MAALSGIWRVEKSVHIGKFEECHLENSCDSAVREYLSRFESGVPKSLCSMAVNKEILHSRAISVTYLTFISPSISNKS